MFTDKKLLILGVIWFLCTSACKLTGSNSTHDIDQVPSQETPTLVPVTVQSPETGFPRLIAYTPTGQPIDQVSRFDAIMGSFMSPNEITAIRELNPNIPIFDYLSGCGLGFNPSPDAATWDNITVKSMPAEWFLTQVGSVLLESVDASTTEFRVADLTATDGTNVYELFVVNDTLLIEGESVMVTAIDTTNKVLTVQRGYIRPASAHHAGTRVAAHVMTWPNNWMMNLSTMTPPATIDTSIGVETFADYNARYGVSLVESGNRDGLFLDNTDPDASNVIWYQNVRTLDPDQSNTLLTDYTAFDQAWNDGIYRFESIMRSNLEPKKFLYANRGMLNYDLLNGYHFEAFPKDDGTTYGGIPWETVVFGPGGYFEWMEKGQDSKLTVIMTYRDDGVPGPFDDPSDLTLTKPCEDPGFQLDYRKMRLGLTTTLLNDGYFAYQDSTVGSSWFCLYWFDEYDNAGSSTGYLGQPLGLAFRPLPSLTLSTNILTDGSFENGATGWSSWIEDEPGYAISHEIDSTTAAVGVASLRVAVTESNGNAWPAIISVAPFQVTSGVRYKLSFWAKAEVPQSIYPYAQQQADPNGGRIWFGKVTLSSEWQQYLISAKADASESETMLTFRMGESTGNIWLDDVKLQTGSDHIWQRDYEGGIVLVNATTDSHTVPLGATFQKIRGTQAPVINDGSLVDEVTLPPLDGLILLRTETR